MHLDGQGELGQSGEEPEHRGRPRHVVLHAVHAVGGLEIEAARVEGDALADDHHALARPLLGSIREMDELGRLETALGHADIGAHAELLTVFPLQHLEPETSRAGNLLGTLGEESRRDHVGGLVHEVPGETGGSRPHPSGPHPFLGRGLASPLRLHHREGVEALRALLLEIFVEAIGTEHRALHCRLGPRARREAGGGEVSRRALRSEVAGSSRGGGGRATHGLRVALGRPQPGHEHPCGGEPALRVDLGDLSRLALEFLRRHDLAEEATELLVEGGEGGRELRLSGVAAHDEGIGANLGEAATIEGELHQCAPPGWELMARWMARARRIISARPSVQSYWPRSPTATQRTSAASVPAWSRPPTLSAT